jgi:prepilin-type processing-associated H-X9-DG protein
MIFSLPLAPTDYEAIMGVQPASIDPARYNSANRFSVMYRNSRVRVADVLDGTSQTIAIVECAGRPLVYWRGRAQGGLDNDQGIGWIDSEGPFSLDGSTSDGSQEGCTPAGGCSYAINKRNNNEPYSFHPRVANALFADGHVAALKDSIALPIMAALCTRAAGEAVSAGSF